MIGSIAVFGPNAAIGDQSDQSGLDCSNLDCWIGLDCFGRSVIFAWKLAANEFLLLYFFCSMSGRGEKNVNNCQKWQKMAKQNQLKQ